ncbi:MAG: hypothetical protein M1838_004376, partial [Thelocarpon superellum]
NTSASINAAANAAANARAVHLRIHPRPRNLTESTQVLRTLQRYGEVVAYQSLSHDPRQPVPHAAVAVFRDERARHDFLKVSPVRFAIKSSRQAADLARPISSIATQFPSAPTPPSPSPSPSSSSPTTREFQVTASPSAFNHRAQIERCRFYGRFVPDLRSAMAQDLRRRGGPVGLCDWNWNGPVELSRLRKKREEMERAREDEEGGLWDWWERGAKAPL